MTTDFRTIDVEADVTVRSASKRELDIRVMPWGRTINTVQGAETFERGAFEGTDPTKVMLHGLEHEAAIGLGQDGKPQIVRHPVGRGVKTWDDDDGQYVTVRVAQTVRGDEVLALAAEGIASGASIEFREVPGGTVTETRSGRRTRVHRRVQWTGLATTYQPAYEDAAVVAVRSEGDPVSDQPALTGDVITTSAAPELTREIFAAMREDRQRQDESVRTSLETLGAQVAELAEQGRRHVNIPPRTDDEPTLSRGEWASAVVRMLSGEHLPDAEMRVVAELITTDNLGVVPPAYISELIGIIDARRPFLATTRRIPTPASGMTINLPKIVTRPTVATQVAEKDELSSTATSITTESYNVVSKGGVGDISLQLLRRSDPSYLSLFTELLAEAYAVNTEDGAVDALLAQAPVVEGGVLDPEALTLGAAWTNSAAVMKRGPDTIWLSSAAVAAFLNAKADGTNMPLYGQLQADFSVPGGVGGNIMGLRPVWVPALDDETAKAIVGPSTGFLWAEDGTFTLQVDVPSKAGRDVGIFGMIWYMPTYPAAFTSYTLS